MSPSCCSFVESMTLAQTTRFLAGGSETARFTVLVNRVNDPVDARVTTDGLVLGIDKDNFKIFVG